MLSPAHLLLALRELEDTVGRLTARVVQLEDQLALKPLLLEPEILQVVNKVIETALFEMPVDGLEASSEDTDLEDDLPVTEIQAEPYIEPEFEPHDEQKLELKTEEREEQDELQDLKESSVVSEDEKSMLLANDTIDIIDDENHFVEVVENNELAQIVETESIPDTDSQASLPAQESSLISRSARHRERKPSFMSRLLK
ncbi:unnamed protein product [Aphanomyces euteiches]